MSNIQGSDSSQPSNSSNRHADASISSIPNPLEHSNILNRNTNDVNVSPSVSRTVPLTSGNSILNQDRRNANTYDSTSLNSNGTRVNSSINSNFNNDNNNNNSNTYNYANNNVNVINNIRNNMNVPILGGFHDMFFKASITYARSVPSSIRRVIEFLILLKAVAAFFVLIYVHTTFIHKPTECLSHLEGNWPRDGILRVEILRNGAADYTIENSYAKEKKLRQQRINEMNLLLTTFKFPMEWPSEVHLESSLEDDIAFQDAERKDKEDEDALFADEPIENISMITWIDGNKSLFSSSWNDLNKFGGTQGFSKDENFETNIDGGMDEFNGTLLQPLSTSKDATDKDPSYRVSSPLKESVSEMEKLVRAVWPEEEYILEFSLEYGFLRLSPQVRQKMNIPVKIVTLDPTKDVCFGDEVTRFILEHFIGYDDLLMVSIKTLAEKENNKGFLRNVVTGEHYRFVTMWMSRASYLFAFGIMIVFTLSISMLLRYSYHQLFVFIADLLQMLEFNTTVSFPVAPLLTVTLALIGMEAVMSEFFNDTTTALYIILIVWISDLYEALCCHRPVTKKHWVRFFYLYHFSFYAYHYRFNGQYSGLALITSWLFIEHSMIYFYHHYELPAVLQQFILAQQTVAINASVTFLNTDRNNEDGTRNLVENSGSASLNEEVAIELRSQNEVQSLFSSITSRLRFRRRTNTSTESSSSNQSDTTIIYTDQPITTTQYANEDASVSFAPQQVFEQINADGNDPRSTTTSVNSSFSPDIIASTSKNVISSPDVVTSSSTEKSTDIVRNLNPLDDRDQPTSSDLSVSSSDIDKRYQRNRNSNVTKSELNADNAELRLERVEL